MENRQLELRFDDDHTVSPDGGLTTLVLLTGTGMGGFFKLGNSQQCRHSSKPRGIYPS